MADTFKPGFWYSGSSVTGVYHAPGGASGGSSVTQAPSGPGASFASVIAASYPSIIAATPPPRLRRAARRITQQMKQPPPRDRQTMSDNRQADTAPPFKQETPQKGDCSGPITQCERLITLVEAVEKPLFVNGADPATADYYMP